MSKNKIEILKENWVESCNKRFFTVKNFAKKNADAGIWPSSEAAIWALRAGAPDNGFGKAFLKVGRRVIIAEDKFWSAIEHLQAAGKR